jgi:hypothetical protein
MKHNKIFTGKTIQCIESIIYMFAIITVIFAITYGPIYISTLPLLFLLGVFGRISFNRPISTTVFGICISLCAIYMQGSVTMLANIVLSFGAGFSIAVGELLGKYIEDILKKIKNEHSISKSKFRRSVAYTCLIIIFSLVMNDYINGNIFTYLKFKDKITTYLKTTYGDQTTFNIINAKYDFLGNQNYVFKIKNNKYGEVNRFVIYLKDPDIIDDGYKKSIIVKNNNTLNLKLSVYISNILKDNLKDINISSEYTDVDRIKLQINKELDLIDDTSIKECAIEIDNILKQFSNFEYYNEITEVSLNLISTKNIKDNVSSVINMEGYKNYSLNNEKLTYEYILHSFYVEYMDN